MIQKLFEILKPLIDWLQDKLQTKFGFLVSGFILGLIAPLSYINYELQYVEVLKNNQENLKAEIDELTEERNFWQQKSFDAESNCLTKMKEMTEFFNTLENTYREKYENEQSRLEVNKQQVSQLNSIKNQLHKLQQEVQK